MLPGVDVIRLGRQYRALRLRRRLRQDDVSERVGVSRSEVGRAERGQADRLRLATLDRIATALGARLEIRLTWNGEALDRLLDAGHAALVEAMVERLRLAGWECAVELSFNVWGERGSVDVLAFHRASRTLLVVEVKSVVPDIQATLMTLDRKARLASELARQRDWNPVTVGRLLVIGESRTSRRRVDAHRAIFDAAFPARGIAVRDWMQAPAGRPPFAGLIFLSSGRPTAARHRVAADGAGARGPSRSNDGSASPQTLPGGHPGSR
jgi:transcriptional regulator with XRE-family HTH domain